MDFVNMEKPAFDKNCVYTLAVPKKPKKGGLSEFRKHSSAKRGGGMPTCFAKDPGKLIIR